MKEVQITNTELKALVDDEDHERVSQQVWYFVTIKKNNYVVTAHSQYLARYVLDYSGPGKVWHINGNALDNQKVNLEDITTAQARMRAKRSRSDNTSGYRGVCFQKGGNGWHARIGVDGKQHHIGYFSDPVDAAKAYDKRALELHGKDAQLNFPDEPGASVNLSKAAKPKVNLPNAT